MVYDDIIRHFGSAAIASRALGLSRATLSRWRHQGIPDTTAAWIEVRTGGALRSGLSVIEPPAKAARQ